MEDSIYLKVVLSESVEVHTNNPEYIVCKKNNENRSAVFKFSEFLFTVINCLKKGISLQAPEDELQISHSTYELSLYYYTLNRLKSFGYIDYIMVFDGTEFIRIVPTSASFEIKTPYHEYDKDKKLSLSKHSLIRVSQQFFSLESPIAECTILIKQPALIEIISLLASPIHIHDLTKISGKSNGHFVQYFIGILIDLKFVSFETDGFQAQSPENNWEYHDLLFHARSRKGRSLGVYGTPSEIKKDFEKLPVFKEPLSDEWIDLQKPDVEKMGVDDLPFQKVLESRRSIRDYAKLPITTEQISEFLFRSARIQTFRKQDIGNDVSFRAYPSGGALHELEIYLVVNKCRGIQKGLYHYCPMHHRLEILKSDTQLIEHVHRDAKNTGACNGDPQILIIVTARHQRVASKYKSIAYRLIMLNLGGLFQTFYLVATAMKLAPCAIGGGNSDMVSKLIGLNYYEEASVGEFMIGSSVCH